MQHLYKSIVNTLLLAVVLFLNGCEVLNYVPPKNIQQRNLDREQVIENYLRVNTHASKSYESLGFGILKIYKPAVFAQLDSLYDVKYTYESENRIREYKQTKNEELIASYRAIASDKENEITYELEHIYSIQNNQDLTIYHDYFLLDYKDSILSRSTLYSYTIPIHLKDIQLKYLFELHFVSGHERFITQEEFNFIKFFKEREQYLIGDDRLQDFMINTLRLMNLARRENSADFVVLTHAMLRNYIVAQNGSIESTTLEPLTAEEDENKRVLSYERTAKWQEKETRRNLSTTMKFSPYLEVLDIQDKILN